MGVPYSESGVSKKIRELEERLEKLERYKSKFGGTVDIYCPQCKNHHNIPFIPGQYNLCLHGGTLKPYKVWVTESGKIFVSNEYGNFEEVEEFKKKK